MSKELLDFYAKTHKGSRYGGAGFRKLGRVLEAIEPFKPKTVLDWGAGQQTLAKALRLNRPELVVYSYDPAIPEIATHPLEQYDAVVTTDVLEHIPYEEIHDVLKEIVGLTSVVGYHHIATFPASLRLPDGRDAHLILQESPWWKEQFEAAGAKVISAIDRGRMNGRDATFACITFIKD